MCYLKSLELLLDIKNRTFIFNDYNKIFIDNRL